MSQVQMDVPLPLKKLNKKIFDEAVKEVKRNFDVTESHVNEGTKDGGYSFYVSSPIINKMVDFNNKDHVALVKYMKELGTDGSITKSQAAKARKLIKKALGDVGQTGIHFIDLTFRKCKYPDWEQNDKDLPKNCDWINVEEIPL